MRCLSALPVCKYFFKKALSTGVFITLIAGLSCTAIAPLKDQASDEPNETVGSSDDSESTSDSTTQDGSEIPTEDETDSQDSDTEPAYIPDWTVSLMPNDYGFTLAEKDNGIFTMQGAWYWYDSRIQDSVDHVKIHQTMDSETPLYWYGKENTVEPRGDREHVSKICLDGTSTDDRLNYLAIGFEVCSTRDNQTPLEFPFPFGDCRPDNEKKQGVKHFKGIEFMIEGSNISQIEVKFKGWGDDDELIPYCTGPDRETGEPNCPQFSEKEGEKYHIFAMAEYAEIQDNQGVRMKLNLDNLQAIHIQVFPTGRWPNSLSFCISDVNAFGDNNISDDTGFLPEREVLDCNTDLHPPETPPASLEWITINNSTEAFDILRSEVTVEQLNQCGKESDVCDLKSINQWETCNTYLSNQDGAPENIGKRAANCVTWCQAQKFCKWIGGRLPKEKEWEAAAKAGKTNEDDLYPAGIGPKPTCNNVVMNNLDTGVGCGVDNLGEVCTKVENMTEPEDKTKRLCDMAGNLWEWVDDKAIAEVDITAENEWQKDYRKIKGGSFNTTAASKAFEITQSSIEHPSVPHSPTRLGFRCVRTPSKK